MKKITTILLLNLLSILAFAQMTSITGVNSLPDKGATKISLLKIVDGVATVISTTNYAEDGSFGFLYKIAKEGFYAIGSEDFSKGQYPIYLKPGDKVNVNIEKRTLKFVGDNTPENNILNKWLEISDVVRFKSLYFMMNQSNFEDFFPEFEKFLTSAEAFKKTINSKNKIFNSKMAQWADFDRDLIALNFLMTPRSKHPEKSQRPEFYKSLNAPSQRYPNDDVFEYLYGVRLLSMYISIYETQTKMDYTERFELLATDRQKGEILAQSALSRIKDYPLAEEFNQKYSKYFVTPSLKERLENKIRELFKAYEGQKTIDFTYPDVNGKMVSLSDFKGKVVLVDVWATWCGPCKQQIPFMKTLEKEFEGKDVVFLSVSVDEEKDKGKWLQMIKDEELAGIHIFASGWSKITKDYNITGIPRFMLFDKKGNLYAIEAPRPSDPKLKEILNNLLVK